MSKSAADEVVMSNYRNGLFRPSFQQAILLLLVALPLLLAADFIIQLSSLSVFGHDEVHYYPNFDFKLIQDGRWLNYLLHDFLRSLPLNVWSWMTGLTIFSSFFLLARMVQGNNFLAAVFASAVLLSPPVSQQILWPASSFVGFAIIFLIFLLKWFRPNLHPWFFYLAGGVAAFGSIQGLYLLMPLLFISNVFGVESKPLIYRAKYLILHIVGFVMGAIMGLLGITLALLVLRGEPRLQPAGWRQTSPANNLEGLGSNLEKVSSDFVHHVTKLATSSLDGPTFAIGVTFSIFVLALILSFNLVKTPFTTIILLMVFASFFVLSIPLAPIIQTRSLVAMYSALLVTLLILNRKATVGRYFISLGLLVIVSLNYGAAAHSYLDRHEATVSFYLEHFSNSPSQNVDYRGLVLRQDGNQSSRQNNALLPSPPRLRPIALEAGYKTYRDCRTEESNFCQGITQSLSHVRPETVEARSFMSGKLIFTELSNWLVITYSEK